MIRRGMQGGAFGCRLAIFPPCHSETPGPVMEISDPWAIAVRRSDQFLPDGIPNDLRYLSLAELCSPGSNFVRNVELRMGSSLIYRMTTC